MANVTLDMLTPEQLDAFDRIKEWYQVDRDRQCFSLAGLAGCGKSSLIKVISDAQLASSVDVITPTGKAAHVLRQKGVPQAQTIHSFVYKYIGKDKLGNPLFEPKETATPPLLICDEASMVSLNILDDLLYTKLRILWVGDHGQLEPVGPDAGLLKNPDIKLENVMRQAQDSPIISFAHQCRVGERPVQVTSPQLTVDRLNDIEVGDGDANWLMSFDQVIVAFNSTRNLINKQIRRAKKFRKTVEVGEKIICLRNDKKKAIFNGMIVTILRIHKEFPESILVDVATDEGDTLYKLYLWREQFGSETRLDPPFWASLFDWGYAITCHKCVAPDTLVETSKGLLRIDEVTASEGFVGTAEGPQRFDKIVSNPAAAALTLCTERGYEVTVTPEHRMMAWDGTQYTLTRADKIKSGTFLRLLRGSALDTNDIPALPPAPLIRTQAKDVVFPLHMTLQLAQWLGHMVADGTVTSHAIRLAKRHPEVVNMVALLTESLFGRAPKVADKLNFRIMELSSVPVSDWCRSLGGLAPNEKYVPSVIRRSPLAFQAAFLKGLFEDGSVALRNGKIDHVEWTTYVEEMARVVQVILLRLGIASSRAKYGGQWRISVYGTAIDAFVDKIGFVADLKIKRLLLGHSDDRRERIPVAKREVSWVVGPDQNAKHRGFLSRVEAIKRGIPEDRLRFLHDRVKTIGHTISKSLCFRVPAVGRFLQNGFDGSNSQGSEWDNVLVLEERCDMWETTRWRYTAATRAAKELTYLTNIVKRAKNTVLE